MNHPVRTKALTMPVRPPARKSQREQATCIHGRSLLTSTAITSWYIPRLIAPLDAIRVFTTALGALRGLADGGVEELVELLFRRASKSRTRSCNWATTCNSAWQSGHSGFPMPQA